MHLHAGREGAVDHRGDDRNSAGTQRRQEVHRVHAAPAETFSTRILQTEWRDVGAVKSFRSSGAGCSRRPETVWKQWTEDEVKWQDPLCAATHLAVTHGQRATALAASPAQMSIQLSTCRRHGHAGSLSMIAVSPQGSACLAKTWIPWQSRVSLRSSSSLLCHSWQQISESDVAKIWRQCSPGRRSRSTSRPPCAVARSRA